MENDTALLARIIEHTPVGIAILSPDRKIRYVNTRAAQMLSCGRKTLVGTAFDLHVTGRLETLWPQVLGGKTQVARVTLSGNDGPETVCALTAFPVGSNESRQDAVAVILRDITGELTIAEQLEKKTIETAKMNTELIHSNIELKRLSEKKSDFLSIASHELKTPLTSIMGYSDLIVDGMKDRVDGGVFRMIESINRAACRLNDVINNILDITRIEQKRLRLKPEMLRLNAVAQDSIEEIAPVAARRSVAINCFFADDLPQFYGDRLRMQQVFTNLLSNAVKYSPDGSAVDVSIVFENGVRFHLAVKDRGIGIDADEQKHIFDPFSEVGELSKHSSNQMRFKGGGTGLGLSIAKGIVERHGGRIWVESEGRGEGPDRFPGSTFHIVLPVISEIEWDDLEKETTVSVAGTGPAPIRTGDARICDSGKPSILIIDPDPETVEVTGMVLANAFDVIPAAGAEQGLALAFQHQPSIILLNSCLPGLDGLRICKILRSQEETRSTPIVFLSPETRREEIEKCFASGANDFIIKPFSGRELMDKIWQLMLKKKTDLYPVVR
ncbi:MAG: response regulator [Chitinispirillaceae bacterium]|nr:response regulator [Chitinispirillaceae bacterium]